jgi:hypothetical protein
VNTYALSEENKNREEVIEAILLNSGYFINRENKAKTTQEQEYQE